MMGGEQLFFLFGPLVFKYSPTQVGLLSSSVGIGRVCALVFVFPLLLRSSRDQVRTSSRVISAGFGLAALCWLGQAFATQSWQPFALAAAEGFDSITLPSLRAVISSLVPESAGAVQGLVAVVETLGAVLVPLGVTNVYRASVAWWPPFTYVALSGAAAVGLLVSCGLRVGRQAGVAKSAEGE